MHSISASSAYCLFGTALCLNSDVWAAWVQAVGSVLAILIAVLIARNQRESQEKTRREADLLECNSLAHGNWFTALDPVHGMRVGRGVYKTDLHASLESGYHKEELKDIADTMADTAKALEAAVRPLRQNKEQRRRARNPTAPRWVQVPKL